MTFPRELIPSDLDDLPPSRIPNPAAVRGRLRAFVAGDLLDPGKHNNPSWTDDDRKALVDEIENLVENLKYHVGVTVDTDEVEQMAAFPGSSTQYFYQPLAVTRAGFSCSLHPPEAPDRAITLLYTAMSCRVDDSVLGYWGRMHVWNGLPSKEASEGVHRPEGEGEVLLLLEGGEEWDPTGGQTPPLQVDSKVLSQVRERLGVSHLSSAQLLSLLTYLCTNTLENEDPSFSCAAHAGITRSSLQREGARRGHTHEDPDDEPVPSAILVLTQFAQLPGTVTAPTFGLVSDGKDNILTEYGWFEVARKELLEKGGGETVGEELMAARRKKYGLE